jgi:HAD superfamily hydrolase (TIGR01509 family)
VQKAFTFDFDGVVLDSISALRNAYYKFLSLYEQTGSEDEFVALNGPSLSEIVHILRRTYELTESFDDLHAEYKKLLRREYMSAPLVTGVRECLHTLKTLGVPRALVTSAPQAEVKKILRENGLDEMFNFIITGDQVLASKPSPEIYLRVKKEYPDYIFFAVEDSENGLIAASSAGMNAIFFDALHRGTNQKTFCRVTSMLLLKKRIEEILDDCCVVEISSSVTVRVEDSYQLLDPDTIAQTDEIWRTALKKPEHALKPLDDALVLYYVAHQSTCDGCVVTAFWGRYRFFYAKRVDPSLHIPFVPLAVSGICVNSKHQFLVGVRRSVTEYEGCVEFAPSGGLSRNHATGISVDFKRQLIDELEEETGLVERDVLSISTLGLIFDINNMVMDIGCLIRVGNVDKSLSQDLGTEYEGLDWKSAEQIVSACRIVPTSRALLSLYRAGV